MLDGVGIGEAPDAAHYGDAGSNSLANTARHVGRLRLPVLQRMGLGNIDDILGVDRVDEPAACVGKMKPRSAGKDSTSGHWELMGCVLSKPFPTFPGGFPPDIVESFEKATGRRVLGNRAASGTGIIEELGEEHMRTGHPILYTSQDSVFQLAAHEAVIAREALYDMCTLARRILVAPHGVARVIARPFAGSPGGFYRTPHRRDFSIPPIYPTVLDDLVKEGHHVLAIGKIGELFCGRGIDHSIPTKDNREGMSETIGALSGGRWDFVFVNLVDFDTMWGHRNDPRAYALGLEEFDSYLNDLLTRVDDSSLLIITSDHGNDPTTTSTDHSREYVPLVAYHTGLERCRWLGVRETFADVAATVADNFGIENRFSGQSFLEQLV